MNKIECFFYVAESGKSPVEEFIKSLDMRGRKKFYYVKSLLETFGRNLAYPHSKYIGDDIFELRFKAMEGHVRTLYFFYSGNQVIFTNGFIKKSDKTPQNEKRIAIERRKNYLQRIGD